MPRGDILVSIEIQGPRGARQGKLLSVIKNALMQKYLIRTNTEGKNVNGGDTVVMTVNERRRILSAD